MSNKLIDGCREFADNGSMPGKALENNVVSLDDAFAYFIHRTQRHLRVHFIALTKGAGREVTPEQYFILNKLWHKPGQTQTDLADVLNDRANITRGLDVLEKKGWVERRSDPSDRRIYRVHLTEGGKKTVKELNPVLVKARKTIYAGLTKKDLSDIKRILGRLETNLNADIKVLKAK